VQLGLVTQGQRQSSLVARGLEDLDRFRAAGLGLRAGARPPVHPGQPSQAEPELARIAERAAQPHGVRLRRDGEVGEPDRIALDRVLIQEISLLVRREHLPVVEHQPVVRHSLAVRSGRGGLPRGRRAMLDDHVVSARLRSVVDDPREVDSLVTIKQRRKDGLVARHPPGGRHGVHDGTASELMRERDPRRRYGQHAALLGHRERGETARHDRLHQPSLRRGRDHRELLHGVPSGSVDVAEPGPHCLCHGVRHATDVAGCENLRDEERVARGHREHLLGVHPGVRTQLAYRIRGQRRRL
jgi:hypothetical protein